MLAAGRQVRKLRFQTVATGLNIAFNGALIPLLAVEGAIVASVASIAVNALLLVRYLRRYSSERLLRRLVAENSFLLAAGLIPAAIMMCVGGEVWAAVAFLASFAGAVVFAGYASMVWKGINKLEGQGKV
jgi:O-antigen/teichoic acid export membrane protein